MATLSGQVAVAAAGTAVQLGTELINGPILVMAPSANIGVIYVGNVSGDVDATNGIELAAGEKLSIDYVRNLTIVMIDAANNDDRAAWCKMKFTME